LEEYALHVSRRLVALGAASAILLTACSSGGAASAPASQPAATTAAQSSAPASTAPESSAPSSSAATGDYSGYKACVAFDTGGLGDKGFNDLAKKGLDDAKALGFQTAYSEAQGATDYAANIQRLIDEGCNSIVTVGFNQTQATVDAVKDANNSDIAFAQVDATWDETTNGKTPANFSGLDFQVDEAGTLAGYVAAALSKSGKIGTYGGQQFPGVTRFMDGYYAGIKIYNEKKGGTAQLLGWDGAKQTGTFVGGDNPWGDPAKGEQLAKTFIDQGADIVAPVAGATGNGSIKAMLAAKGYAIGVDTDQALSLPEYSKAILTSAQKVIDVAVLETFKKNAAGDKGGENFEGTLANKGVTIAPYHDLDSAVPADVKADVEQLRADIASGAIKVADYLK
jgi:basic membrane protein A and related proteins